MVKRVSLHMFKRGALANVTVKGLKTSQIKNLIVGMVTNMRAARAARTLESSSNQQHELTRLGG